jgi:hypothetical protein
MEKWVSCAVGGLVHMCSWGHPSIQAERVICWLLIGEGACNHERIPSPQRSAVTYLWSSEDNVFLYLLKKCVWKLSHEVGPRTMLMYSLEICIWSFLIQEFVDEWCYFLNSVLTFQSVFCTLIIWISQRLSSLYSPFCKFSSFSRLVLFPTWKLGASQPAQACRRSMRRNII